MTLSPTMRLFLVAGAILSGLVATMRLVESFAENELYRKDFIQEYAFAKSAIAGEDPYLPMPEMVARWFDPPPKVNWAHPATHTPVTAVLSIPLALLDYPPAAFLWLAFELAVFAAAWWALFRWWGEAIPWPTRLVLVLLSLSLGPVIQELWFGNLSMILLGFVLAAWLTLRADRDIAGGIWLGLAIAVKLTAWPVVLFLLLKRRWQAVAAAAAVVIGLHLIAAAVLGPERIVDYYTRVGPEISRRYKQHDGNYSLWTVSSRLFAEFDSVINNFVAFAPWSAPSFELPLRLALPIAGLIAGLFLALRCRQFDSSVGILLCVSLPVNPVAWDHSLLIAAIPIAVVFRHLAWAEWPRRETVAAAICFVLTMFPQQAYMRGLTSVFATKRNETFFMPFAAGLITYVPLLALIGWIWLLWRSDSMPRETPFSGEPKATADRVTR
jgi:hypothetical protein